MNLMFDVCNTTSANTGKKNGVVVRLQREFEGKGFRKPQYIGCQNHVLDLILRRALDCYFLTTSKKIEINYDFVEAILSDYEKLPVDYCEMTEAPEVENLTWRNDHKFLFELCEAYKLFQASELYTSKNQAAKTSITSQYKVEFESRFCTHSLFLAFKSATEA